MVREDDYGEVWSCDGHCFKVFASEKEFVHHLKMVEKAK